MGTTYITGDTHGEYMRFTDGRPEGEETWNENDRLIVAGDFGFVYRGDRIESAQLDELSRKPYDICFVDGNHECFPKINEYPIVDYHGAKAHRIRKNVFHLIRGNIYKFDDKTFWVMGGGYSSDRHRRRLGIDYWNEEMPSSEEYKHAASTIKEAGMKVDYIITHTAPTNIIRKMGLEADMHERELNGFLEWIEHEVQFKHWFFGHFHQDVNICSKFSALWKNVQTV